jgi:cobalt-precorrin-5B (C1)-methyltransferase
MTYQEILANARTCMGPYCKSCPVCNGVACKNTVPGPGAKGIGTGFIRNYQKWQELCVNMDTICENVPVDTSYNFFGKQVALPVFAAPVGAMQLHYGDKYDDLTYNDILVSACAGAGIAAFTGDGTNPAVIQAAAEALKKSHGCGVPTIKPWNIDLVREKAELVGAAHLANRDFNCVSDGQRQRILLARAVCQQPQVLLLDEPTSFLDIKGKIELLTILQKLAHEQQLAVIVTLHELDMAQKIADAVVCVSPHGVSAPMSPTQAFARENIKALYGLTEVQYSAVFGPPKPEKPQFEHYVRSGQKLLRCGYTTGTCAALAAAGAARLLLTGTAPETVALRTPKGIVVEVAPLFCRTVAEGAECAIEKDGGDDVDVTTGLPVTATVTLLPGTPEICITGGAGVGRVTKPGLDQPVGQAAINHVPRQMITEALRREAEAACYPGGFAVTISIPGGEEVARRTFNPHIGVEGGLSVLGTSGIVEPMSQQAILDTIQLEMNQAALRAKDHRRLILAPGNYGLDYLHETYPQFATIPVVKTSNFIGDTLDMAAAAHFEQVLLVGHIGKLCKLAGGIMNTHSHTADCRTELFCTHAALCGADRKVCTALYNAATTDACLEILDTAGLRKPVLQSLLAAIQLHLDRRAGGAFRVGAVLFSNQHGPLGQTETAARLLDEWKE